MNNIGNLFRIGLLSFMVGCCSSGTFLGQSNSSSVEESNPVLKIERMKQATVAIATQSSDVYTLGCTGVWVDTDVVLTASHCVDDPENPLIFVVAYDDFKQKKVRPAVVMAREDSNDLALLIVDTAGLKTHPVIELGGSSFSGDSVHIIGHPVGYLWTYAHGYVASVREDMEGPNGKSFKKILQISAPIWMGNSGGGVFDDNGRLLGISSWISKSGPHLSFFIHKDTIEEFMVAEMARREK